MSDQVQNQPQGQPQQGGKSPADRLIDLLGFDPTKQPTLGPKNGDLFKEALAEILKERNDKARAKATELFRKAITLSEDRKKARQAFNKADQTFEKELGKVLSQIQSLVSGAEIAPEAEEATAPAA